MLRAGSISRVDFAQLQSQYSSDEYQVVVASSTLDNYKLQLKQLLELDIMEEMNPAVPGVKEENVLKALPSKDEVYATALKVMPQIRRGELGIEAAKLEEKAHVPDSSLPYPYPPAWERDICRTTTSKAAARYGTASTKT